jgi:hypothetical protein
MKFTATLAFLLVLATAAFADNKTRIGSLPLKNGSVILVQEYLSKARLPEKVLVVSDYEDVCAFSSGTVTKVLEIDDRYSVFVRKGSHYYVYGNLKGVAVEEGDRLGKGEFLGEVRYSSRYREHQMEMQIWYDNGRRTCRLPNKQVVGILQGDPPAPPKIEKKAIAKKKTPARKYAAKGKHSKKKVYAKKSSKKAVKKKAVKKTTAKKVVKAKKKKK